MLLFIYQLSINKPGIFHFWCGQINAEYAMTDDAPAYFNAWSAVFDRTGQKLLCNWHVKKSWNNVSHDIIFELCTLNCYSHNFSTLQNLMKITCPKKRTVARKFLLVLEKETNESKFFAYLREYIKILNATEMSDFAKVWTMLLNNCPWLLAIIFISISVFSSQLLRRA